MKAARIHAYGGPEAVTIEDIDTPAVGKGQVLIAVHASSLNPFDTKVREGVMKDAIPLTFPATLGGDIAGVVAGVGEGVSEFRKGDAVYGQANVVSGNSGAFAEFAVTATNEVAHKPKNIDFEQAASLALVGVSALQALTEHLQLQSGQKIFIHGGAGGIGTVAIQIAKHIGAHVATTATGDGVEYVRQLGADEVIDYKASDFATQLSGYDAVFDTVGGEDFTKALVVLKPGGVAVSMIAKADESVAAQRGVTAITQGTEVTTKRLEALTNLVEQGVVTAHVDGAFPLSEIREAFTARETGTVRGKIAIRVAQSDTAS